MPLAMYLGSNQMDLELVLFDYIKFYSKVRTGRINKGNV
jgi:hypothetical protein